MFTLNVEVECKYCDRLTKNGSKICDKCAAHIARRAREYRAKLLRRIK